MSLIDFTNINEIACEACNDDVYDAYEVVEDECYIDVDENKDINIIIIMEASNGLHGNDPSWQGAIWTITLNEDLEEIDAVHEVQ
tara:strand:+ start:2369 stop:2623 length:255 start_codon:yes stop_codon:yes gene_type:complete